MLDEYGNAYSNPFPAFFNAEEHPPSEIPNLPYKVYFKLDGSCIEVFYYNDTLIVCTLGSFQSEQAKIAEEMIRVKYGIDLFQKGYTYLFELIVPQNKIVLSYGDKQELILLSIRNNDTDEEYLPEKFGNFPVVQECNSTIEQLMIEKKRQDFINEEGFVILFNNGFRLKIKYEEYFRLHRIVTGCNSRAIWEILKEGKTLPLANIPDEFFKYITDISEKLKLEYAAIELSARNIYEQIRVEGQTKKDFALKALSEENKHYSSIAFRMFENRDYSEIIWKMIRPEAEESKFNSFMGLQTEA